MKTKITLEVGEHGLSSCCDSYLAALWHAAQWNHAPPDDPEACRLVEQVGREIILRWLAKTPPELWMRQGNHERTLPGIERAAKAGGVIEAARKVVECDHGANLPAYRERAMLTIDELEKALKAFYAQ